KPTTNTAAPAKPLTINRGCIARWFLYSGVAIARTPRKRRATAVTSQTTSVPIHVRGSTSISQGRVLAQGTECATRAQPMPRARRKEAGSYQARSENDRMRKTSGTRRQRGLAGGEGAGLRPTRLQARVFPCRGLKDELH